MEDNLTAHQETSTRGPPADEAEEIPRVQEAQLRVEVIRAKLTVTRFEKLDEWAKTEVEQNCVDADVTMEDEAIRATSMCTQMNRHYGELPRQCYVVF